MVKLIKLNDGTYNDLRLLMAKKKFEALEVADYVNCNITFDDLIKDLLKTYRNSLKNDFKQEMIRND